MRRPWTGNYCIYAHALSRPAERRLGNAPRPGTDADLRRLEGALEAVLRTAGFVRPGRAGVGPLGRSVEAVRFGTDGTPALGVGHSHARSVAVQEVIHLNNFSDLSFQQHSYTGPSGSGSGPPAGLVKVVPAVTPAPATAQAQPQEPTQAATPVVHERTPPEPRPQPAPPPGPPVFHERPQPDPRDRAQPALRPERQALLQARIKDLQLHLAGTPLEKLHPAALRGAGGQGHLASARSATCRTSGAARPACRSSASPSTWRTRTCTPSRRSWAAARRPSARS